MANQLKGQATPEQIKQWKEKYKRGIYSLEIGGHIGYFRNPEIMDMNAAMANVTKDNPLDYFTNIGRDTFIGGSEELIDEESNLAMDFVETIKPKLEGKKGKLVNL